MHTTAAKLGCNFGRLVGGAGFVYTVWSFDLWVRHPGWFNEHLILKSSEQCMCVVGLIVVLTVGYISHSDF